MAAEYHWSKDDIFNLYPREIEILVEKAAKRKKDKTKEDLYNMALAACVPHTKDGGKKFFNDLIRGDDEEEVTQETIDRDNRLAKRLLGG